MPTTFEVYANAPRGNYCTLPIRDVEILPDVHHCKTCNEEVAFDKSVKPFGSFVHASSSAEDHGYVSIKTRCAYCNSEDDAVYYQHAWHDAVECSRCGGVDGRAIGD
jgi:hypothetical protein